MVKKKKRNSKFKRNMATNTKKKSTPAVLTKAVSDRVLQYANTADHPELMDRYAALLGTVRPVDVALASYTDLLKDGAKGALASLKSSLATESGVLKFQVTRIAVRRIGDPDFSIVDARKVATEYGRMGYDGIAAVRF